MKLAFMGTPEYVIAPLEKLLDCGYADVAGVYTQPDRPVGRGGAMSPPPVGKYCRERNIPLFQPASLRNVVEHQELAALEPDVVVVAAYGKMLPPEVLSIPRHGCLNIHPSLLPRHRGPSPVVTALLDGDRTTGVTVMVVDEGMDSGPIVAQETTEIGTDETAGSLTERLFRAGGELVVSILPRWVAGDLSPTVQDEALATVTRKITKQDGEADWNLAAIELARYARAFDPWPSLYTYWEGKTLKLSKARFMSTVGDRAERPGTVVQTTDNQVAAVTGDGLLLLQELQLEGRRPMAAEEFVRGQRDFVGAMLPS